LAITKAYRKAMKHKPLPAFGWTLLLHILMSCCNAVAAPNNIADAQPITALNTLINDSSDGANSEPGEPSHAGYGIPALNSLWYSFKPKASGYYVITATAPVVAHVAIYTGTTISNLVDIQNRSGTYVFLAAGTKYLIALDSPLTGSTSIKIEPALVISNTSLKETKGQLEGAIIDYTASSDIKPRDNGKLSLTVTQSGNFSAVLTLGSGSYRFKGKLNPAQTVIDINRGKLPTSRLTILPSFMPIPPNNLESELQGIYGDFQPDVLYPETSIGFLLLTRRKSTVKFDTAMARKYVYAATLPATEKHSNTISGGLSVSEQGIISGVTILPDGGLSTYAIPALSSEPADFDAIAMQRLYNGSGHMLSTFRARSNLIQRPSASHYWARARPDKRWDFLYQSSLRMLVTEGSLRSYQKPDAGQRIWDNEITTANAALTLQDGIGSTPTNILLGLSDKNVFSITIDLPEVKGFSAKVNTATGFVSGKVQVKVGDVFIPLTYRGFYSSAPGLRKILGSASSPNSIWSFIINPVLL
jgi:hypothetical protein